MEGQRKKRWKHLTDICCQPLQWCRASGGNATRHCIHCTAVTMFYHLISTIKTNPCERVEKCAIMCIKCVGGNPRSDSDSYSDRDWVWDWDGDEDGDGFTGWAKNNATELLFNDFGFFGLDVLTPCSFFGKCFRQRQSESETTADTALGCLKLSLLVVAPELYNFPNTNYK